MNIVKKSESARISILGLSAAIGVSLIFSSCFLVEKEDSDSGSEKTVYVALGNSLTAGVQNFGMRKDWQLQSYPALLAKYMGIDDFEIPAVDSPGIGARRLNGATATPLFLDDEGNISLAPVKNARALFSNSSLPRPYNNLGILGATTSDMLRAYDSSSSQAGNNSFFNLVLRGGLLHNTTMLRQAVNLNPDIITLWIGNNDILGGVTAGTVIEGQTVTPAALYTRMMDLVLDTLLDETDARIFLANIPSITSIPFVTAIPPYLFNPKTNELINPQSPIRFLSEESDMQYVLIPALEEILAGTGIPQQLGGNGKPLGAGLTLDSTEAATADRLISEYNDYLKGKAAAESRITLVDIFDLMDRLKKGKISGLTANFALQDPQKSAFSLDGIHPNSKGYKVVAETFLDAINSAMGTDYSPE